MSYTKSLIKKENNLRAYILEAVSRLRLATVDSLIESDERVLEYKISFVSKKYSIRSYIPTATRRLVERGLLDWRRSDSGKSFLALTEKGREVLFKERLALVSRDKVKGQKWDKKWRIVIFDIGEQKRFWRDRLRLELFGLGFVKLQNSVWISPYPCEELIALLRTELRVGKEVIYLTVDRFEGDISLRKHFKLL